MKTFRLLSLLVLLICFALPSMSQTSQPGVVMEYRGAKKKKPLGGVSIKVKYASSTKSDNNGTFNLLFNRLKPGDRVECSNKDRDIAKSGYEIFNRDALEQWYISKDGVPFTIVMARSKDMKVLRDQYSRASSTSYRRQQDKELQELNALRQQGIIKEIEYKRREKEIKDYYNEKLDNIDNYIDKFVQIDLSELSQEEAAIIELVQQGNFDEAIRLYDVLDYAGKISQLSNNIIKQRDAEDQIKSKRMQTETQRDSLWEGLLCQINVLEMRGGKKSYEQIDSLINTAVTSDSTWFAALLYYAQFMSEQKQYDSAINFYEKCLSLTSDSWQQGQIYRAIGLLELELGHFNESENALCLAHDYIQALVQQKKIYYNYYGQIHYDLAKMYATMRRYDKAEQHFLEAQKQYRALRNDGDDYTREMLSLQNDFGRMYLDMRDFRTALEMITATYSDAVESLNTSPKDSKDYKRLVTEKELVASIGSNYGLANKSYMNYDKAESLYLESLSIYKELYNRNPKAYRNNLADIASALSSLYAKTMDTQKAQEYSKIAEMHYDTLLLVSADAVIPSIARMQKSQLDFYFEKRYFSEIRPIVEKSYELISALYKDYPNVYRSEMCDILSIMGQDYAIHNQIPEAKACFVNAKLLADTLCNDNPSTYAYQRLKTLDNLAIISSMMKEYKEDSIYSLMAYNVCKSLYELDQVVYGPDMARMAYNQSIFYLQTIDYTKAKSLSNEAEQIYESLFDKHPLIFGRDYISVLNLASRISDNVKDTAEYELYTNKAYALSKDLYQKDPKHYVDLYVKCLDNVADCILERDIERSLAYRLEGVNMIRDMYQKEPEVYVKTMGQMYLTTFRSYKSNNDYNNAMAMLDSALNVYQPFYEKEPQAFGMLMAACYFSKGQLADTSLDNKDLAIDNYRKALPLYQIEMERAIVDGQESVAKEYLDYVQSIHLLLYDIYKEKGSYQEAIEQLKEMLLLEPDDEEVKEEIEELEKRISHN